MTTIQYTIQILKTLLVCILVFSLSCRFFGAREERKPLTKVQTIAGSDRRIGEPFGIATSDVGTYVSDGEKGVIWKLGVNNEPKVFVEGLDTPSQIAFDVKGGLFVADSGSHTIKRISKDGKVELIAGVENESGYRDGDAKSALFNAPIGLAVFGEKIYIADTYNDRIRVIEKGVVTTLAGNSQGFADDLTGTNAKFDTPTGLAVWTDGRLLVADAGNRRIRVVESDGKTWTLTGSGREVLKDGILSEAEFVQPTAITVERRGRIYVADGNAIRVIGRRMFPLVETISNDERGFADGSSRRAKFNRPSGLATDRDGNLFVSDSANQLIRAFTGDDIGKQLGLKDFDAKRLSATEFREQFPPRWTYDPPEKKREIAGALGEIRGEIKDEDSQAWFHNGLDIVGGYGEKTRFVRDEKVLRPIAVQNFDTTRELIRMPTIGYIHIRLGRDVNAKPFEDSRFQFSLNTDDKPVNLRVPRGSKFRAGEVIGTLNAFNHVHLIAGRSGGEMNALDALILPGASDSRVPTIENVELFDENWREFETRNANKRIEIDGKIRIVVQAFDQMDGNAARRKLGLYKLGYQILNDNGETVVGHEKPTWTIRFDRLPATKVVRLVYAKGSKSGAIGETVFRYIITNEVSGTSAREGFFDSFSLKDGDYILRIFAADFFGNIASKDVKFRK